MLCFCIRLFRLGKSEAWGAGKKRKPKRSGLEKKGTWKEGDKDPVWSTNPGSVRRSWRSERCMEKNAWRCAGTLPRHARGW